MLIDTVPTVPRLQDVFSNIPRPNKHIQSPKTSPNQRQQMPILQNDTKY